MTEIMLRQVCQEEGLKPLDQFSIERIKNAVDDYIFENCTINDDEIACKKYLESLFGAFNFMNNRARYTNLVWARNCFFWYLMIIKKYTCTRVMNEYGFDHTTIIRARNLIQDIHKTNAYYPEIIKFKNKFI